MSISWRNPYNGYVPWTQCSTCGQDWPSQKVSYNPRFGWQCPPCWDGLIQRDQIDTPVFPYEGTRKVPSPLTNTLLEGIAPGSLTQTYTYNFRDRATGSIYEVKMVPVQIAPNGSISYTGTATPTITLGENTLFPVFDALKWTNNYAFYLSNGALATEIYNPMGPYRATTAQGICDFGTPTTGPITYLLYDRNFPENIYHVIFHENDDATYPGQIEIVSATGTAVGGILLNENWNFYLKTPDGDPDSTHVQANYDDVPFFDLIDWDNSHTFYVDTTTYGYPELIYVP